MIEIFWLESLKGRDLYGDLEIDGRIIFKWILGKERGRLLTRSVCLRIGIGGGLFGYDDAQSGFIKCGEILD
jgi:hypothetical protein